MRHCKELVTALELMAAYNSAVRHEAQAASQHHRLLPLPQLPRSSQPHAVREYLVRRTLVPIYSLHVLATIARLDLDATKNALNQDNVEAGTRVASAEERTSLHGELRRRLWTTEETTHAEMRGGAVMTAVAEMAVAEMEDTGVGLESRNKAAARCRMHQDHSMVAHRKYLHHHRRQAHLQEIHQSGNVARHATTPHLSTTGVAAEVASSGLEEAADARMTGAEAEDLAVRRT
jgi:hypothetical protein